MSSSCKEGSYEKYKIHSEWLRSSFIIPFGHYIKGGDYDGPVDKLLVGREGQRKHLIDLLRQPAERSAILVTGRRGSGKSSFVNNCIYEYKNDKYSAWLKSEVGLTFINYLIAILLMLVLLMPEVILLVCIHSAKQISLYTQTALSILCITKWSFLLYVSLKNIYSMLRISKIVMLFPERKGGVREIPDKHILYNTLFLYTLIIFSGLLVFFIFFANINNTWNFSTNESYFFYFIFIMLLIAIFAIDVSVTKKIKDIKEYEDRDENSNNKNNFITRIGNFTPRALFLRQFYPVFSVTINLGFKGLRHNQVIHAMLVGLKDKLNEHYSVKKYSALYFRIFCAYLLVSLLLEYVIGSNNLLTISVLDFQFKYNIHIFEYISLFMILYYIIYYSQKIIIKKEYQNIIDKINILLRDLSWRLDVSRKNGTSFMMSTLYSSLSKSNEISVTSHRDEPLDPRLVEMQFINLLKEIQVIGISTPFSSGYIHRLTKPSVIFVFDELDKIGVQEDPEIGLIHINENSNTDSDGEGLNRLRSVSITNLLSDMKNIVTTAPGRFIFIGGRELHDLWLADETAREPFLTSIFDTEIYLPSFLTDHGKENGELQDRIKEYVAYRFRRSFYLMQNYNYNKNKSIYIKFLYYNILNSRKHLYPLHPDKPEVIFPNAISHNQDRKNLINTWFSKILTIPIPYKYNESIKNYKEFSSTPFDTSEYIFKKNITDSEKNYDLPSKDFGLNLHAEICEEFKSSFINFLTYRSGGNPKKITSLFDEFMRQRWSHGKYFSQYLDKYYIANNSSLEKERFIHNLSFGDTEIYRIQLLSNIYIHLARPYSKYIVQRDDKLGPALFYLCDFLLKFHSRAFTWRNLFRLDEYVILFRVPDLDYIYTRLVNALLPTHLHKVNNGLYTFRFKSGFSKELQYISRISRNEMASFNFTLDESRNMKYLYAKKQNKEGQKENWDVIIALGELYDFDHEYDLSRENYRKAIYILDERFERRHGEQAVLLAKTAKKNGGEFIKSDVTWGLERLRLMLLLGMTYERDNKLRSAIAIYKDARNLSRSIIKTYLISEKHNINGASIETGNRKELVKHFDILFQPLFAEAWATDKLPGSIESSLTIVDTALYDVAKILPFVNRLDEEVAKSAWDVKHANFSLVFSQLQNKIGDLAFFKGDCYEHARRGMKECKTKEYQGYLLKSAKHYATAMHEIKAFIQYRTQSSSMKLNANTFPRKKYTLSSRSLPIYIKNQLSLNMSDMADSMFSMIIVHDIFDINEDDRSCLIDEGSPGFVFRNNKICHSNIETHLIQRPQDAYSLIIKWVTSTMKSDSDYEAKILIDLTENYPSIGLINCYDCKSWLGFYNSDGFQKFSKYLNNVFKSRGANNINDNYTAQNMYKDLSFDKEYSSLQRFFMAISLAGASAKLLKKADEFVNASEEYHSIAEITMNALCWYSLIEFIKFINKKAKIKKSSAFAIDLMMFFIDFSSHCLNEANDLLLQFHSANCDDEKHTQFDHLALFIYYDLLFIIALSVLVEELFNVFENFDKKNHIKAIELLKKRRLSAISICSLEVKSVEDNAELMAEINKALQVKLAQYRYPIIARLKGYRYLIYINLIIDMVFSNERQYASSEKRLADLLDIAMHMDELHSLYDAPFHNTPTEHGICLAILVAYINMFEIFWYKNNDVGNLIVDDIARKNLKLKHRAVKYYQKSDQMHSMGKSYYEAVAPLYYLYDDFNDRRIHRGHALQMMGSSLFTEIIEIIDKMKKPNESSQDVLENWEHCLTWWKIDPVETV